MKSSEKSCSEQSRKLENCLAYHLATVNRLMTFVSSGSTPSIQSLNIQDDRESSYKTLFNNLKTSFFTSRFKIKDSDVFFCHNMQAQRYGQGS